MEIIDCIDLYQRNPATNTDKQYRIQLEKRPDGYACIGYNGRRGARLQPQPKEVGVDLATARNAYDALVKKKIKEKYTPDVSGAAYVGTDLAGKDTGLRPQLLVAIEEHDALALLSNASWGLQQKMDGERVMIRKCGDDIVGANRRGLAVPLPQPLVDALRTVADDFVLDGELVKGAVFAFDLLELRNADLRSYGYVVRYRHLTTICQALASEHVHLVTLHTNHSEKAPVFARLKEFAEGVVFKNLDAPYEEGRSGSWGPALKFKFWSSLSCLVAAHNEQRSIALALLDDAGTVVPVGNVTVKANQQVPEVGSIVEVKYLYMVDSLYQPELLAVRTDVDRSECTVSQLKYKPDTAQSA